MCTIGNPLMDLGTTLGYWTNHNDTDLMKKLNFNPSSVIGNPTREELKDLLGRARAKKGIFEGDLVNGELEIGQIAGIIHRIASAEEIIKEIVNDFEVLKKSF